MSTACVCNSTNFSNADIESLVLTAYEELTVAISDAEIRATRHGDTGFLILCAALVFIMTPGLGYFYGGMARTKNCLSLIMLCFLSMAVVLIQWVCFGFSLSFSEYGNKFIGDFYYGGGTNVGGQYLSYVTAVSSITFFLYQAMFAMVTAALIFGSSAERMRLFPALLFIFIWTTAVYDVVAHWTWCINGWLFTMGALDFAGGGPVHIASGFSGLAMAIVLGRRHGFPHHSHHWKPHNLSYVFLGTGLLWMGWFAFNGGSAVAGTSRAAMAATVTNLAAAAGGLTWMFIDFRAEFKLSGLGFCSGAVAGLVGITPGAGFVAPWAGVVIGFVTALCCNLTCRLKHVLGYDDTLDAFGVHGMGGFIGNILAGVFAQKWVAALDGGVIEGGGIDGHWKQVLYQLAAAGATAAWAFLITLILTFIIPLRVTPEMEHIGVDISEMGEKAYDHHCATGPVNPLPPGCAGAPPPPLYEKQPLAAHDYMHANPRPAEAPGAVPPPPNFDDYARGNIHHRRPASAGAAVAAATGGTRPSQISPAGGQYY